MDPASWIEKYNTGHPYTQEEYNMLKGALRTVGSEEHDLIYDVTKFLDSITSSLFNDPVGTFI